MIYFFLNLIANILIDDGMFRIFLKYHSFFFFTAILLSCNAPRNNPLDPENPENKISTIEGFVKTIKVPQLPIENTKVFWVNEGIITTSNEQGYFIIENIERTNGWLIIEKENFSTDSLFINFGNKKKITKNIFLNTTPKMIDLKFYSITTNKYPSRQKYNLEVIADIIDEENDIDSVFIENNELNFKKELLYNASEKYYENTISLENLNIISIDIVIGKDFYINVLDSEGKKFEIGKSNIKRIIKEEIEITSPLGRDTVLTPNPLLKWYKFTPGFKFRYLLEIKTDEVDPVLVWNKEIGPDEIQLESEANLSSGDYFWVIWAIDEFENRTRSKPASFIIK